MVKAEGIINWIASKASTFSALPNITPASTAHALVFAEINVACWARKK